MGSHSFNRTLLWPSLYQLSKTNNDQKKGCFFLISSGWLVVGSVAMVMQGVFFLFYRTGCFLTGSQKLITVCCGSNSLVPPNKSVSLSHHWGKQQFFILYFGIVCSKILKLAVEYIFHENAKFWPIVAYFGQFWLFRRAFLHFMEIR